MGQAEIIGIIENAYPSFLSSQEIGDIAGIRTPYKVLKQIRKYRTDEIEVIQLTIHNKKYNQRNNFLYGWKPPNNLKAGSR